MWLSYRPPRGYCTLSKDCPLAPDRNNLFFCSLDCDFSCCYFDKVRFHPYFSTKDLFVSGLGLTIAISEQGLSVVSGEGLSIVSWLGPAVTLSWLGVAVVVFGLGLTVVVSGLGPSVVVSGRGLSVVSGLGRLLLSLDRGLLLVSLDWN
jgi:hypothetical protein